MMRMSKMQVDSYQRVYLLRVIQIRLLQVYWRQMERVKRVQHYQLSQVQWKSSGRLWSNKGSTNSYWLIQNRIVKKEAMIISQLIVQWHLVGCQINKSQQISYRIMVQKLSRKHLSLVTTRSSTKAYSLSIKKQSNRNQVEQWLVEPQTKYQILYRNSLNRKDYLDNSMG